MQNRNDHHPLIRYVDLEKAFEDVDERFPEDLSAVRLTYIKDVHFDDYELEIFIYGQNSGLDDAPVVHSGISNPENFLVDGTPEIKPEMVIAVFDEKIQHLLIERGIPIEWNAGESSAQVIDLTGYDPNLLLEAEDC
ncbi:hypothetical protein [Desulfococcus sp.]|uniref:hypothetical protein n=1 Tax=Desulfococcus sp. TaxID=2025834 RepID=UPI003593F139